MSITKKNVTNENWFRDLFINEAKPALERHSGTGGEEGFIDVTELPTEGIDQDKVYRLNETVEQDLFGLRVALSKDMATMVGLSHTVLTMEEYCNLEASMGPGGSDAMKVIYGEYVVDSLPDNPEMTYADSAGGVAHFHYYITNNENSDVYMYPQSAGKWMTVSEATGFPYGGVIYDESEIVEPSGYVTPYYIVKSKVSTTATHYGIPNEEGTKKVYVYTSEAGWREYGPIATTET